MKGFIQVERFAALLNISVKTGGRRGSGEIGMIKKFKKKGGGDGKEK